LQLIRPTHSVITLHTRNSHSKVKCLQTQSLRMTSEVAKVPCRVKISNEVSLLGMQYALQPTAP